MRIGEALRYQEGVAGRTRRENGQNYFSLYERVFYGLVLAMASNSRLLLRFSFVNTLMNLIKVVNRFITYHIFTGFNLPLHIGKNAILAWEIVSYAYI